MSKRISFVHMDRMRVNTSANAFTYNNNLLAYASHLLGAITKMMGWKPRYIQAAILTNEQIVAKIVEFNPSIVGFTVFDYTVPRTLELCSMIKAALPNVIIIVGGYTPSMAPEFILGQPIDLACIGEGLETFKEFLAQVETGVFDWSAINGLAYEVDGELVKTAPRARTQDLDAYPMADWSKKDLEAFGGSIGTPFKPNQKNVIQLHVSWGCKNNCRFCVTGKMTGHCVVRRDPEQVVADMVYARDILGSNAVFFTDAAINADEEYLTILCAMLIEAGLGESIDWTAQVLVGISRKLAKLMKKAGCLRLTMGVEDPRSGMAEELGKAYHSIEQVISSSRAMDAAGIINRINLVLNFSGNLDTIVEDYVDCLLAIMPDAIRLAFETPFAGTDLYKSLKDGALGSDWERRDTDKPVRLDIDLTFAQQEEIRIRILKGFYNHPRFAEHLREKVAKHPELLESFQEHLAKLAKAGIANIQL